MVRPITTNQPAAPLAFYVQRDETDPRLYFDPRVKVTRVVDSVEANSDADAEIDWQETKKHGTLPVRHEMTDAWMNRFYSPRLRCAVIEIQPGVSDLRDMPVLLHGFIDGHGLSINGSPNRGGSFRRRSMKIRSIFRRSGRRNVSTIHGRLMLSQEASEALDAEDPPSTDPIDMDWGDLAAGVSALPAIFNFQGKPNRLARPVLVKHDHAHDPNAPIHIFTYDGDPNAEYWTFLQALRYLIMVYLPYGLDEQIDPGDLFTTLSSQGAEAWWSMTEAESDALLSGNVNWGWRNMMVRNCQNFSVEGLNLIEAMAAFTPQCGLHVGESHTNETQSGEVRVLSHLDFWVDDQKSSDVLHLEHNASQYFPNGQLRPVADVLANSNVQSANLRCDFGSTVEIVYVFGDRFWFITTAEFKPLWEPDSLWDDVDSEDADDYRADAYGDPFVLNKDGEFYKRYNPNGLSFDELDYRIVGRLWGIDPAGEIDFLNFNRETGPYTDYDAPFLIPDVTGQVRRRRMIDHPEVKPQSGEQKKIRLEISLDGGDTWGPLEAVFTVHKQLSAIYFKAPNLLSIGREVIEDNGTVDNFYDAYLKHALRIRATFAIELDDRIGAEADTAGSGSVSPLAGTGVTKMYLNPKSFKRRKVNTISVDPSYAATIEDVNDQAAIDRVAKARLAQISVAKWKGNPVIPWIETERYPLGTPIRGIARVNGGGLLSFGGDSKRGSGYPHVVAKIYNAADQTTELVLRDHSLRKGLKGPY